MDPLLEWAKGSRLILLTVHRRENIGEAMENIFKAVRRIVDGFKDVKVIYPIHKNPKVREVAEPIFRGENRIKLIEPLDVFDFHNFMAHSYFIMTDSGGIQEEAPSLGKPVLVLRNRTERPEGIRAGTLKLIGTEFETVYEETKRMLTDEKIYREMSRAVNPYGDGHASERIVKIILDQFVCRDRKRMGTELKI
jgi:UDP-N-acetylglucosamine 2-epimerase